MKNSRVAKKDTVKQKRTALKELLATKAASYECLNPNSLERNIGNESWRKRLINTLLTWASDETTVELVYFYRDYNIARPTMYDWASKYPDVAEAWAYAKLLIAGNRRNGSIKRKFDPTSSYRGIHKLDPEEEEIDNYMAKLKKSSGENSIGFFCMDVSKPRVISQEELQLEKNPNNFIVTVNRQNTEEL